MEQSLESTKLPTYEINHFNGSGNLNRRRHKTALNDAENIQQRTGILNKFPE